ncbi:PREDICTED: cell division control protein 45 homolog [Nicrophorus vespilloides]|uniref:Cell division control protein 45 homolog n=1 Tax=Nicrophorus vespilloides TaxID=110193 RepID=A0ABM1N162_NICVS|nr:PREDICTED: cell division control protein 45 homolog [Nicrophorus vespilloides]
MYVEDLKKDFYEFLAGKRIFLMVNYDIDSICACKILQSLLKYKHVVYTLVVVKGIEDLKTAFNENCEDVKYFIMINCGGTIDIVDLLEPEDEITFYILDSHRPTDLCNIYSNGQIRLLWNPEDDCEVPDFHSVFREDESDEDEEDDDEDSEEGRSKRRRLGEEAIMARRERRLWEDNRNRIMFEYSQFTFYGKASALLMFDLAWKLNKDDKDLLWLAIVSLTEQMVFGKIENTQYVLETGNLQAHANRLQNRTNDTDVHTSLKITFEKDLRLILYRHWTVESSLKHSMFTACKLRLWSLKGDKKLNQLLADMGLPLAQSKQSYRSMDLQLRQEFQGSIEKLSEKYDLDGIVYASFTLQYGYRNKFCASDIVFAMLAILESASKDKRPEECFHSSLECLSRSKSNLLYAGIDRAKTITVKLFKTVQSALDMKHIVSAGPFVYYIVQEGCLDWYMYSQQHILSLLAQFILRAYVSMSKNRRAASLPLIVSAPHDIETGMCIVLGIPPLCENSPKNFFGKAFEQAAERTNCDTGCDFFDTAYFKLHTKHRTRFFDALTTLLS